MTNSAERVTERKREKESGAGGRVRERATEREGEKGKESGWEREQERIRRSVMCT